MVEFKQIWKEFKDWTYENGVALKNKAKPYKQCIFGTLAGVSLVYVLPEGCAWARTNGGQVFTKKIEILDVDSDGLEDAIERNYFFRDGVYVMQKGSDGKSKKYALFDADLTLRFDSGEAPVGSRNK